MTPPRRSIYRGCWVAGDGATRRAGAEAAGGDQTPHADPMHESKDWSKNKTKGKRTVVGTAPNHRRARAGSRQRARRAKRVCARNCSGAKSPTKKGESVCACVRACVCVRARVYVRGRRVLGKEVLASHSGVVVVRGGCTKRIYSQTCTRWTEQQPEVGASAEPCAAVQRVDASRGVLLRGLAKNNGGAPKRKALHAAAVPCTRLRLEPLRPFKWAFKRPPSIPGRLERLGESPTNINT